MKRTLLSCSPPSRSPRSGQPRPRTFLCSNPPPDPWQGRDQPRLLDARWHRHHKPEVVHLTHATTGRSSIGPRRQRRSNPSSALGWKGTASGRAQLGMTGDIGRARRRPRDLCRGTHDAKRGDMLVMRSEADARRCTTPRHRSLRTRDFDAVNSGINDLPKTATDGSHTASNFEAAYAKVVNDAQAQSFNMTTTCWKGRVKTAGQHSDGFGPPCVSSTTAVKRSASSHQQDRQRYGPQRVASTGAFGASTQRQGLGNDPDYTNHFEDETSAPST